MGMKMMVCIVCTILYGCPGPDCPMFTLNDSLALDIKRYFGCATSIEQDAWMLCGEEKSHSWSSFGIFGRWLRIYSLQFSAFALILWCAVLCCSVLCVFVCDRVNAMCKQRAFIFIMSFWSWTKLERVPLMVFVGIRYGRVSCVCVCSPGSNMRRQ